MKKFLCFTLGILFAAGSFIFSGAAVTVGATSARPEEKMYSSVIMPLGGTIYTYISTQIYYARKECDYYINPYALPLYIASELSNSCAITAAGTAIGYYDRLYENLIPNHSGFYFMGYFAYTSQGPAVNAMHQELYTKMGSTASGTTIVGYKNGFTNYVASKGYTAGLTKAYGNSVLNKVQYMTALNNGKLLTVFVDGFSLTSFGSFYNYTNYDEVTYCILVGGHTMMAYGYENIRYYDASDNLIQEDCYLYVHSGYVTPGLAMVKLNQYITIDDGYVTEIY